jgi:hypothetical protein
VTINGIAPDRKNDRHRCTAGSNGLFMISVGLWGDLWSKEASNLDITGGTEEQDGMTEFLIWEFRHELEKGGSSSLFLAGRGYPIWTTRGVS